MDLLTQSLHLSPLALLIAVPGRLHFLNLLRTKLHSDPEPLQVSNPYLSCLLCTPITLFGDCGFFCCQCSETGSHRMAPTGEPPRVSGRVNKAEWPCCAMIHSPKSLCCSQLCLYS